MPNKKVIIYLVFLLIISLVVARGFFRNDILAGHDSLAYPVTQQQFHLNIEGGVLFPRWAPDMRYGFGHVKLQYRPPLLHYFAEIVFLLTGNIFLSLNMAVVSFVFIAACGMFVFARQYIKPEFALISAAAYVTANYFLADIYLRGAYYEVAAYAWMPWILWCQHHISQCTGNGSERPEMSSCGWRVLLVSCSACFWCFIICGHPQIAAFFMPLSFSFIIFSGISNRNYKGIVVNVVLCLIGFMLAAPYFYVALRELPYIRMQLFDLGMENYYRHFLDIKTLLLESWPVQYQYYSGAIDYLGRPLHPEMRAFNSWALIVLGIVPVFWFWRKADDRLFQKMSYFFYIWVIATIFIATPLSWGVWAIADVLHSFNFPWRALTVTSLCVAVLFGVVVERLMGDMKNCHIRFFGVLLILLFLLVDAFPHSRGWRFKERFTHSSLSRKSIRKQANVPQQFYTPKWVKNYAVQPRLNPLMIVEGQGRAVVAARGAVLWEIDIKADTPLTFQVAHYYYPGWQLTGIRDVPIKPEISPDGFMRFYIPEGTYRAELKFGLTNDRVVGYVFSVLGTILLIGGCFWIRRSF